MERESIRVTRSVLLPVSEITLRVSRSSGPGGQHAQKSSTRVEALFDVEASTALTDTQKRRVVARAGPVLRAVAQDERSQARNRELAVERLVAEAPRGARRSAAPRCDAPGARQRRSVDATASSAGRGRRRSGGRRPRNRLAAVDVLRLASLLPELPRERTRLLDNLGRVRREVGPITMELSDAVADHMNIRRGEVHEVVSFYSFLEVPTDAVRVCTGPVCDCFGARELLESTPGAIEVACLGHCDLAPAMTRGDEIVPSGDAFHERRAGRRARDTRHDARGLRGARWPFAPPRGAVTRADRGRAEDVGPHRLWGRWVPNRDEVGGGLARSRPALRRRERRRGRAGDDQGPLCDGAPATSDARGDGARNARPRCPGGLRLSPRGVRHRSQQVAARRSTSFAPRACSTDCRSSSSSAPVRTSRARRPRCSSPWRADERCRG